MMMRVTMLAALAGTMLIAGCAGRPANPVAAVQLGDDTRSCASLIGEMAQIDADIARKLPDTQKTGKNVALGVAGAFFLVPWFFMDFTQSEQIEIDALRNRHVRLTAIATDKGCGAAPRANVDAMGKAMDAAKAKQK